MIIKRAPKIKKSLRFLNRSHRTEGVGYFISTIFPEALKLSAVRR